MTGAGYSGTPLAKKPGIKEGFKIKLVHAPAHYFMLFTDLPENISLYTGTKTKKNFIHYFARHAEELRDDLLSIKNELEQDGMLWVSWYKKASGIPTDVTEQLVRTLPLQMPGRY